MKALVKIAPIVIILACAASLFFAFRLSGQKRDLKGQVESAKTDLDRTTAKLGDTQKRLESASADLKQSKDDLVATKANLDVKETELGQRKHEIEELTQAKAQAVQDLAAAKEKLDAAEKTMAGLQERMGAAGVTNIEELGKKVQALADENKMLGDKVAALNTENQTLKDKVAESTTTPEGLRGRVALAQSQWNFLIMDIGKGQKVQPESEYLVYRDSTLVAKAKVTTVYPNSSVADIVPGFSKGAPREGDTVVYKKM